MYNKYSRLTEIHRQQRVHHTTKASGAFQSTRRYGYAVVFNLFSGSNLFHHTNLRPAFLVGKDTSWPEMLRLRCLVHGTQGQGDVRCVLQRERRAGGIQQP
jgi:hypothetical protein